MPATAFELNLAQTLSFEIWQFGGEFAALHNRFKTLDFTRESWLEGRQGPER